MLSLEFRFSQYLFSGPYLQEWQRVTERSSFPNVAGSSVVPHPQIMDHKLIMVMAVTYLLYLGDSLINIFIYIYIYTVRTRYNDIYGRRQNYRYSEFVVIVNAGHEEKTNSVPRNVCH